MNFLLFFLRAVILQRERAIFGFEFFKAVSQSLQSELVVKSRNNQFFLVSRVWQGIFSAGPVLNMGKPLVFTITFSQNVAGNPDDELMDIPDFFPQRLPPYAIQNFIRELFGKRALIPFIILNQPRAEAAILFPSRRWVRIQPDQEAIQIGLFLIVSGTSRFHETNQDYNYYFHSPCKVNAAQ